jgi:ketosteroid isomerase-like protein
MGNLETVQKVYEAFGRGDVPAILDELADDVRWDVWDPPVIDTAKHAAASSS